MNKADNLVVLVFPRFLKIRLYFGPSLLHLGLGSCLRKALPGKDVIEDIVAKLHGPPQPNVEHISSPCGGNVQLELI